MTTDTTPNAAYGQCEVQNNSSGVAMTTISSESANEYSTISFDDRYIYEKIDSIYEAIK